MKTETVQLKVSDGSEMAAFVVWPESRAPKKGIIVIQEAFGVNNYIEDICQRFAREGFLAVAPELYHRTQTGLQIPYTDLPASVPHRDAMTEEGTIADLQATFDYLKSQQIDRFAAIGFCMGGRIAFLANTVLPLQAAVTFYGSRIPTLLSRVSDITAPHLFCWGGKDKGISRAERTETLEALDTAGKVYTNVEFSEAGHGFFCDQRAAYHANSARQAWSLTLEFLRTYING